MSADENREQLNENALAFEYVVGTLAAEQRQAVEQRLEQSSVLAERVSFWEEQTLAMIPEQERPVDPEVWDAIVQRTMDAPDKDLKPSAAGFGQWWQWLMPSVAAVCLMFVLFGYYPGKTSGVPNTDYVAVLTTTSGEAVLTAVTTEENKTMWLQWSDSAFSPEHDAQLWAISRRDGQIRSISVFDRPGINKVTLDEARWRLVTDSEYLLLTLEESGGSPIDEPSEELLARGVCVRLSVNRS